MYLFDSEKESECLEREREREREYKNEANLIRREV